MLDEVDEEEEEEDDKDGVATAELGREVVKMTLLF
jgi:hypothetical protein